MGYQVTTAANGKGAILKVAEEDIQPVLLITDVVMPGMSGKELADSLLGIRPNMKVLYMSGYTARTQPLQRILEQGSPFIQKPFSQKELAAQVNEMLGKG